MVEAVTPPNGTNRGATGMPRRKGAKAAVPKITSTYEFPVLSSGNK